MVNALPPPSRGSGPSPRPRFQQTRFQRRIAQAYGSLETWSLNPWRRISLLLIVLLASFAVGGGLGSISGALSYLDPISALVAVALIELAVRLRRPLLRRSGGRRLGLQLLDMARMGLLYGLVLEGFKLL